MCAWMEGVRFKAFIIWACAAEVADAECLFPILGHILKGEAAAGFCGVVYPFMPLERFWLRPRGVMQSRVVRHFLERPPTHRARKTIRL